MQSLGTPRLPRDSNHVLLRLESCTHSHVHIHTCFLWWYLGAIYVLSFRNNIFSQQDRSRCRVLFAMSSFYAKPFFHLLSLSLTLESWCYTFVFDYILLIGWGHREWVLHSIKYCAALQLRIKQLVQATYARHISHPCECQGERMAQAPPPAWCCGARQGCETVWTRVSDECQTCRAAHNLILESADAVAKTAILLSGWNVAAYTCCTTPTVRSTCAPRVTSPPRRAVRSHSH